MKPPDPRDWLPEGHQRDLVEHQGPDDQHRMVLDWRVIVDNIYALLRFARLARGTTGLGPVTVDATGPAGVPVTAWEVRAARSQRRLFLINKRSAPITVNVQAPGHVLT